MSASLQRLEHMHRYTWLVSEIRKSFSTLFLGVILPFFAVEAADTRQAYESTYRALPAEPVLIENVTVLTGLGKQIDKGFILFIDSKIKAVGAMSEIAGIIIPAGVTRINGVGKWVTPGLVDPHSHIGGMGIGGINEAIGPNTAEVFVEHSFWAHEPGLMQALKGGVTTHLFLPGSVNLISGHGVVLKNVPGQSVLDVKYPGAPYVMKVTCGENPMRNYGQKGRAPASRMGNIAVLRSIWIEARSYMDRRDKHRRQLAKGKTDRMFKIDPRQEALADVLDGKTHLHIHCYRADDMLTWIEVAKEFDFQIAAFHHATEAYKITEALREADICASVWPDLWGFKHEAYDMVEQNVIMVSQAGACAVLHSDTLYKMKHMNQEMAKAMAAGRRVGHDISRAEAIGWITSAPAELLGIGEQTGSLEVGKAADIVLWNGDPASSYTKTEKVFIDGVLMFDRSNPDNTLRTDFELGMFKPGKASE